MTIGRLMASLRRYLDFLRWLLVLLPVDWMASYRRNTGRSDAMLVVHPCRIGDMILWLGAARGLRELYPSYRIVLVAARAITSGSALAVPLLPSAA